MPKIKPKAPLFAGLSCDDAPPVVDYVALNPGPPTPAARGAKPRPTRSPGAAPSARPSMRPASRYLAQAGNVLKPNSAFRTLSMEGDAHEFRPLTRTEGAENLGITPEHVAERKPFPVLSQDAETGRMVPRVRTKTGSVPRGTRATPGARNTSSKDAFGKPQPSAPAGERRSRGVEKVAYSRGKGMTAKKVVTRAEQDRAAEMAALESYAYLLAAEMADAEAARAAREEARKELHAAMGRKREAQARGYAEGVAMAQADIRKYRELARYKGEK